ncbi:hypothetical protein POM88_035867 [Heracleum sosnowskyi]|uniref:Uncharacterized protein n=1 Tax=Heracleum sosnowskyi TaxID=360622 RepID=A0AAD8HPA0_9APIA|nr:hypothetical protein POM88_035867 [Heracleum sosnowskyi]
MYDDYDWEDWSCFQDTNVTNTENKDMGDGGGDVGDSAGDVGESRNKDRPFAEKNDIEDVQELPPLVPVSTDISSSEDNFEIYIQLVLLLKDHIFSIVEALLAYMRSIKSVLTHCWLLGLCESHLSLWMTYNLFRFHGAKRELCG